MSDKMSYKDVFNEFISMESRLNLFSYEFQGIGLWELIRGEVFNRIVQKLKLQNEPHTFVRQQRFIDKLISYGRLLMNAIIHNPLYKRYKRDILIFDHPRKLLIDGIYEDIYTKDLIDCLDGNRFEVLERHYLGKHFMKTSQNRVYLDFFTISSNLLSIIFKRQIIRRITKLDRDFVRNINREIETIFQVEFNLMNIVLDKTALFRANYHLYNCLFKKRKPKTIFIVVAYSHQGLVAAAKTNNIEVIELQHGVITPYNIAYSYPNTNENLHYFPDKLYLFGEYWAETIHLPISRDNIKIFGFPYLNRRRKKYMNQKKKCKQIIFISQGTVGETLAYYAYHLAKDLPSHKIIYKLHPSENAHLGHIYSFLKEAKSLSNFTLSGGGSTDLYQLLAESEFQVGVSSAAIIEGLVFQCKTVLINSPGVEHLEGLVKRGYVLLAHSPEELVCHISDFNAESIDPDFFYQGLNQN